MVFIHLGGNVVTTGSLTLDRNIMKRKTAYLRAALPDSIIIWIDILQGLDFQNSDYSFLEKNKPLRQTIGGPL